MKNIVLFFCLFTVSTYAISKPMRVGSWNTMLQPWFIWEDEVYDHIPGNYDVLALQEVWTTEARDEILSKTKHKYPFHYWPKEYNEKIGCDMSNPQTFAGITSLYLNCLQEAGIDTRTVQQPIDPVPLQCTYYAIGLAITFFETTGYEGQQCLACVINGLELLEQGAPAWDILNVCGSGNGPKYGHGGVNGQLILSKYPIRDVEEHHLEAFVVNRVNIHATINGIRFGFGHFSFNLLEDAGYGPLMWGATQPTHAQDFIDAGVDVIVGDFNSGPNYQPEGYNLLLASGYKQATLADVPTWCDTPHAGFLPCVNAISIPMPIDHIFVRDNAPILSWWPSTFNNKPVEMSDHIGVSAWLFCWWCW